MGHFRSISETRTAIKLYVTWAMRSRVITINHINGFEKHVTHNWFLTNSFLPQNCSNASLDFYGYVLDFYKLLLVKLLPLVKNCVLLKKFKAFQVLSW